MDEGIRENGNYGYTESSYSSLLDILSWIGLLSDSRVNIISLDTSIDFPSVGFKTWRLVAFGLDLFLLFI